MKKNGFTLAEVLITLGIVGVVSALTIPSLMSNTTKEQIGPKLAKAVSAFEQANQALLNANSVDSLTDARVLSPSSPQDYTKELGKYMKISYPVSSNYALFNTKDGFSYAVNIKQTPSGSDPAYKQHVGTVLLDIDGIKNGVGKTVPSNSDPTTTWGTDRFYFSWWNDGSLRPLGGTDWNGNTVNSSDNASHHWSTLCPAAPDSITNAKACTGHIFENNLKVLYK